MNKFLLTLTMLLCCFIGLSQTKNNPWTPVGSTQQRAINSRITADKTIEFTLDLTAFKADLNKVNARGSQSQTGKTEHTISFPRTDGSIEAFRVVEASALHPDLAAKYPGIKSYAGQGIEDPSATIRFSVSDQRGFHGMILSGTSGASYIDPVSEEQSTYSIYARDDIEDLSKEFSCYTEGESKSNASNRSTAAFATDDSKLRKYRLAMSCTAEYGNIFAGSGTDAQKIANILAQMNITMTRVNGIYERDLAITMEIIANNDEIMYFGSTSADPWTNEYNSKTQTVIDAAIGDNNYDIGHNFNTTGGGNAGCIGCVCTTGSKGSGYTGRADPTGDAFDIDYVAHEIGHQFGGYHTQSNSSCRSGDGTTEVEPGSASTIMGYAGICSSNVQNNSDAYFHYVNIRDISANVQSGVSSGCAEIISLSNNAPTADAGSDYFIPKSTAFVLRGSATDPDGDVLTYTWEQNDPENPNSNASPTSTRSVGPLFRSFEGTTSPDRYMPQISDIVSGDLTPTWEAIPSIARSMEFALTVRDNNAGGGQTADDLMSVTVVNVTPFTMSSPNTAVTWNAGQTETVTWNVGSTSSSPISCSNVDILLSIDGGFTYPVTLLSNTANDGSADITVPTNISSDCRVMVAAADNIFFDISDVDFTIGGSVACTAIVPTGLTATNEGGSSVDLSWTDVSGATYEIAYSVSGGPTSTVTTGSNSYTLSGLSPLTAYDVQVRSVCSDATSAYSSSVSFTTTDVQLTYCASNGNDVSDEYISRVQLGTIDNSTGASSGGYSDQTSISTTLIVGDANTITITPTWTGSIYNEGYSVWIDYNVDGDFEDTDEQVFTSAATSSTSVSGSFTVPASAVSGNTRMRVAMKFSAIPTSCESFNYGEVEDYTVTIATSSADTEAPTTPSSLAASAVTETTIDISWTGSIDNVAVLGYEILVDGVSQGTTTTNSASLSGLTSNTAYTIIVRAVDAAGNTSANASLVVTTLDTTTGDCTDVTMTLVLDRYPAETTWTVTDNAGTIVMSGGSYNSTTDSEATKIDTECLDDGCYTFTINDSYGDGICCSYGSGSYNLEDESGTLLASGGSFASSDSENFCVNSGSARVEGELIERFRPTVVELLYPNPTSDVLRVNLPEDDMESIEVHSMNGTKVDNMTINNGSIDVSDLEAGVYILFIKTKKANLIRNFIKID